MKGRTEWMAERAEDAADIALGKRAGREEGGSEGRRRPPDA